ILSSLSFLALAATAQAQTTFNTPGAWTYTVPANVNTIYVSVAGGGGGGGDFDINGGNGGTGAAGADITAALAVTPGQVLSGTIAGGGVGGNGGTCSGAGAGGTGAGTGGAGGLPSCGGGGSGAGAGGGGGTTLAINGTAALQAGGGGGGGGGSQWNAGTNGAALGASVPTSLATCGSTGNGSAGAQANVDGGGGGGGGGGYTGGAGGTFGQDGTGPGTGIQATGGGYGGSCFTTADAGLLTNLALSAAGGAGGAGAISSGAGLNGSGGFVTLTAIVLSPSTLPAATVGAAYSQTITASGGTSPYTFALTGTLPAGLTFSAGVLSGTPTAGGSFSFTVTATDSSAAPGPYSGSQAYTLTVNPPTIVLSPSTLPAATVGIAYSQTITASGGTSPYTYAVTVGTLPAGLTLSSAGVLSGTPTAGGSFTFTVTATDSSTGTGPYTGSQTYTLTVGAPTIILSPATLPAATVAAAYNQTITASGGTAPYTYATAGPLPAGLTLSSGGVLSGTPTAGGTFNFTVTATDSSTGAGAPYTGSRAYTLTVNPPTITLAPTSLPAATVAAAYSQTITASGGTSPYTYAVTVGTLPAGLTLSSAGVLSGTPTAGGTFSFTVTATDSSTGTGPYKGTQAYTLTVNPPTITLAPTSLPSGTNNVAYPSQTITASGGTSPYTYAVTVGALPAGLTLSSAGVLSGTPTVGGTFNFTVTATDSSTGAGPYTGSQAYTLTVNPGTQTLTITAPPDIYINLGPATVTVTASSGLPVTLTSTTPTICTVSGTGPTFTVTLLATGTCTLTASQAGDANYAPVSQNVSFIVLAQVAPTPMLDRRALLLLAALIGLVALVRARRA
ncbi:MAG: putative Ig domain-containing protein, partial [Xanthomonadaceae bacterium]|nr:putative Ig domain-containing protein [Xanthomonadaceae bacterium]